jgi:hypothetical protein
MHGCVGEECRQATKVLTRNESRQQMCSHDTSRCCCHASQVLLSRPAAPVLSAPLPVGCAIFGAPKLALPHD